MIGAHYSQWPNIQMWRTCHCTPCLSCLTHCSVFHCILSFTVSILSYTVSCLSLYFVSHGILYSTVFCLSLYVVFHCILCFTVCWLSLYLSLPLYFVFRFILSITVFCLLLYLLVSTAFYSELRDPEWKLNNFQILFITTAWEMACAEILVQYLSERIHL